MTTKRQGRGAGGSAALGLLPVTSLAAGLLLVGAAVLAQVPDPPPPATATGQAQDRAAASADDLGTDAGGPGTDAADLGTDSGGRGAAATAPRSTSAPGTSGADSAPAPSPRAPAPLPAAEPVSVRVPAIDVQSPLHPLGLAADGTLEVPTGAQVDEAAWYAGSPTPGEAGPSVIEGHVTGPGGRPSVFFELGALALGDRVEVDRADGRTAVFEVYRVDSYAKDAFPTVAVYGPTSGPELRLITCGGEFDDTTGHHVDNTVVFARAVADQA